MRGKGFPPASLPCAKCGGNCIHNGPYVNCLDCGHQEGRVTHANRQLAANSKTGEDGAKSPKMGGRRRTNTKGKTASPGTGQMDFEGGIVGSVKSYREAETEAKSTIPDTAIMNRVHITSKSRHQPCDRLFVMAHGKPTCPACGYIEETAEAIQMLIDAFNPSGDVA